ncbi:hypothetical protein V1505DRAFT_43022 [Lipomyces doorenjongii]
MKIICPLLFTQPNDCRSAKLLHGIMSKYSSYPEVDISHARIPAQVDSSNNKDQNESASAAMSPTAGDGIIAEQDEKAEHNRRVWGLSRVTFFLVLGAIALALAVGLGTGLGVGLNNERTKPGVLSTSVVTLTLPATTATYTKPGVVSISTRTLTISTTAPSASSSVFPISHSFCVPQTNVVSGPRFDDLTSWYLTLGYNVPSNFESVEWQDGSPGGLYLPRDKNNSQQIYAGLVQKVNLEPNTQYSARYSFKLVQYESVSQDDNAQNILVWLRLAQASNTSNVLEPELRYWSNTTVESVNATTLTMRSNFTSFDDGGAEIILYALSPIADMYFYTMSIFNTTDNSCPNPDPTYPLSDVQPMFGYSYNPGRNV